MQSSEREVGGLDQSGERSDEGLQLEYILKVKVTRLAAGTNYSMNVAIERA